MHRIWSQRHKDSNPWQIDVISTPNTNNWEENDDLKDDANTDLAMWKSSSLSQHFLGHLTQVVFPTAPYTLFTWIPGHQILLIFPFHWSFLFFFLCCFLLGSRGSLTLISITLRGYAGFASVPSCFGHVQLFVTAWTVALQDPVPGILQARILEWVAMPSSMGSSQPKDRTCIFYISCTGRHILYN